MVWLRAEEAQEPWHGGLIFLFLSASAVVVGQERAPCGIGDGHVMYLRRVYWVCRGIYFLKSRMFFFLCFEHTPGAFLFILLVSYVGTYAPCAGMREH